MHTANMASVTNADDNDKNSIFVCIQWYVYTVISTLFQCACLWCKVCVITYARFLNRGVTLGLVNPRLVGYPWGKSRGNFCHF